MKNVLLPVYTAGHFTELFRIARLLKSTARYAPTFWFWRGYYGDGRRDHTACASADIPWIEDRGDGAAAGVPASMRDARPPSWATMARTSLSGLPFPLSAVPAAARQAIETSQARTLVAAQRPDLVILAEDSVAYETAALINAAHQRQVPAAIVPFTICNALEPAESYFWNPAFGLEHWENRLAAWLFPKWAFTHRGRRMVRLPAAQLLAKELFRLAPPLPWQMNSGAADVIAVESDFMRAYYRKEGLPESQLVVTGAVTDDVLAEGLQQRTTRRTELCTELGLPTDRRLILCALPPDHFSVSAAQADVSDYQTLLRFWIQTLAALPNATTVVCLHPRTSYEELKHIEEWGVRISQRDTASLVPLCDFFVASVSATIRWAIACGKPVLNYDVYRLRWTDFDEAPGVLRVEDRQAFREALHRMVSDGPFFEEIRKKQENDASRWARLDGHSGERLVDCFDRLITRK